MKKTMKMKGMKEGSKMEKSIDKKMGKDTKKMVGKMKMFKKGK